MEFLLFNLFGLMGSHGSIAVGEQRLSWSRPSKSAVFGLIGAACGKSRSDSVFHHGLHKDLCFAVKTVNRGQFELDFHSTQTLPSLRKRSPAPQTRKEELAHDPTKLHTILSQREWNTDAFFTVALWFRNQSDLSLQKILKALKFPHFTLYLGRKSAPLGLPLNPTIISASCLIDAYDKHQFNDVESEVVEQLQATSQSEQDNINEIAFDINPPITPEQYRIEYRRDSVLNRENWFFNEREEGIYLVPDATT